MNINAVRNINFGEHAGKWVFIQLPPNPRRKPKDNSETDTYNGKTKQPTPKKPSDNKTLTEKTLNALDSAYDAVRDAIAD